jgi:hypothetical protein
MVEKFLYFWQIICSEFLDIIVSGPINKVWGILMFCDRLQLLSVVKRHNLVAVSVNYVNWAVDVGHSVNVREPVSGQRPPQIENDPKDAH